MVRGSFRYREKSEALDPCMVCGSLLPLSFLPVAVLRWKP